MRGLSLVTRFLALLASLWFGDFNPSTVAPLSACRIVQFARAACHAIFFFFDLELEHDVTFHARFEREAFHARCLDRLSVIAHKLRMFVAIWLKIA